MELIKAEKCDLPEIKRLYRQAFPRAERKPFSVLTGKTRKSEMEIFRISDEGETLGLVISALCGDMFLLNYFAVIPEARGLGVGSAMLPQIRALHPDMRFFLETESSDGLDENSVPARRKRFYLRNGLLDSGLRSRLFGVRMDILTDGSPMTIDEYIGFYEKLFTPLVRPFVKKA